MAIINCKSGCHNVVEGLQMKSLYTCHHLDQKFNEKAIWDFLSFLPIDDLYSLAQTASGKKLIPESKQEAIEMILLYTSDIEKLFSYRRISSQILMEYLFTNNIRLKGHATRLQLLSDVLNLWAEKFPRIEQKNISYVKSSSVSSESSTLYSSINDSKEIVAVPKIKSDVFATDFVEWFYSMLNSVHKNSLMRPKSEFNSSIFCANSSVDIFLVSFDCKHEVHCVGSEDCAKGLSETIEKHNLLFMPNTDNGIQAEQSSYGLVKVFSCGTLHISDAFIGIFEQEFGLVKNPSDKCWQIFYTKLNLKTTTSQMLALPSMPIFEIDAT